MPDGDIGAGDTAADRAEAIPEQGVPADSEEDWIYELASTGLAIQEVNGKVLGLTDQAGDITRRFITPTIVPGGETGASVEMVINHQRRRRAGAPYGALDLRTLRGGDWVRITLGSAETLRLFKHLEALYVIGASGVTREARRLRVVDADEVTIAGSLAGVVARLRAEHGDEELSAHLASLAPDLVRVVALKLEHARRMDAIAEFEAHLRPGAGAEVWTEPQWKEFFNRHNWIFGHNLDYQFLTDELPEAYVGGRRPSGGGSHLADHVMGTGGDWSFAVLVEIKRPDTPLLGGHYREGVYKISVDLSASVAQAQANCQALIRMSATAEGARELDALEMSVADPRGIVLIGDTAELRDVDRRETFERYRRNLWNPTVMTYDELLNRAKFQVARTAPPDSTTAPRAASGRAVDSVADANLTPARRPQHRGSIVISAGPGRVEREPRWERPRSASPTLAAADEESDPDDDLPF